MGDPGEDALEEQEEGERARKRARVGGEDAAEEGMEEEAGAGAPAQETDDNGSATGRCRHHAAQGLLAYANGEFEDAHKHFGLALEVCPPSSDGPNSDAAPLTFKVYARKKTGEVQRCSAHPIVVSLSTLRCRPHPFPPPVLWYRSGLVFEAHRLLYHSA